MWLTPPQPREPQWRLWEQFEQRWEKRQRGREVARSPTLLGFPLAIWETLI